MSLKSLIGLETDAEAAKAERQALVEKLQAKTVRWGDDARGPEPWPAGARYAEPVKAEFSPQTAGLAVAHDGIILSGGPFSGAETKVPRGAAEYERPAADQDRFIPARYRRTGKRDDSGLTVFQYVSPAASA